MKALFIHDHPFIQDKTSGEIYTSGNLNSSLWERYLKHFNSLTVIGRCKEEIDTSKYNLAEKENVEFRLFNEVKGGADYYLKSKTIKRVLIDEINKHDIIILRMPAIISTFAADYCIKNNKKYIVEVVGCVWDANWNYGGIFPKILAPYSFFKMKDVVKKAGAAIYVTEKFLQRRYPTDAVFFTSASNVIIKEVKEEVLSNRLEKIKSKSQNELFHIGVIGNIAVKYKGYDVLLNAIKRLPISLQKRVKVSFVGGGNPTYLKSLIAQSRLADQVEVIGKLKAGKEIFNFLDQIDFYIHPSKQEGLPRVVIEAMSRACPILASSVAGTPELIAEEFLHNPGDAKKLSGDLSRLIQNPDLWKMIAKQNFEKSKEYLFPVLENRREVFFQKIKNS